MDIIRSLIIVISVLVAIFVPQALAMFYVTPREPKPEEHEFDYR